MKKLRITVEGKVYDVDVEIIGGEDDDSILPSYYHQQQQKSISYDANLIEPQAIPNLQAKPRPKKSAAAGSVDDSSLNAAINGVVVEILVKVGQTVKADEPVMVLEAMKMKTNISSPRAGVIRSIEVGVNDRVEMGQLLVTYE